MAAANHPVSQPGTGPKTAFQGMSRDAIDGSHSGITIPHVAAIVPGFTTQTKFTSATTYGTTPAVAQTYTSAALAADAVTTLTAPVTAASVVPVAAVTGSGTTVLQGMLASGVGVPPNTSVLSISNNNVTLSQNVTMQNGAQITFAATNGIRLGGSIQYTGATVGYVFFGASAPTDLTTGFQLSPGQIVPLSQFGGGVIPQDPIWLASKTAGELFIIGLQS